MVILFSLCIFLGLSEFGLLLGLDFKHSFTQFQIFPPYLLLCCIKLINFLLHPFQFLMSFFIKFLKPPNLPLFLLTNLLRNLNILVLDLTIMVPYIPLQLVPFVIKCLFLSLEIGIDLDLIVEVSLVLDSDCD